MALSGAEVRQLEHLRIRANHARPQASWVGARTARLRGVGTEFHDYRPYQPGDDPRRIDWTIHARLRQLVVRVPRADAHLVVHLLVDISRSMGVGVPSKLDVAARLAEALACVALARRDVAGLAVFDRGVRTLAAPRSGGWQARRLTTLLDALTPGASSAATPALAEYAASVRGPGLAVVISDFLQPDGPAAGLRALEHAGLTPVIVQVVASEEQQLRIDDEIELVDSEDPVRTRLVDAAATGEYHAQMRRLTQALREYAAGLGTPYVLVETSAGFHTMLQRAVEAGLLERRG